MSIWPQFDGVYQRKSDEVFLFLKIMNYERFPFGKYKGSQISELPPAYIIYALQTFDLPDELKSALLES